MKESYNTRKVKEKNEWQRACFVVIHMKDQMAKPKQLMWFPNLSQHALWSDHQQNGDTSVPDYLCPEWSNLICLPKTSFY